MGQHNAKCPPLEGGVYTSRTQNEPAQQDVYMLPANDEAHFWLNGYVNKQNCRIWSEANPQVYVETPLHKEKLTV
ncbi:hypothetical protein TNCV_5041 [Trichonephila clavipes]|nr:hypothetical protein TNCV_5041 [Trichonephila clavipes]